MKLLHNRKLNSQGFTLVELLLVVAIIAVLSTLAVGVLGSASNDAKAAATRARVELIGQVLQTQLEEYEVRRIPFGGNIVNLTNFIIDNGSDGNGGVGGSGQWENRGATGQFFVHFKNLNRMFTIDLIRAELPNGRSNNPGLGQFPSPGLVTYLSTVLGVDTDPSSGNPDYLAIRTYAQSGRIGPWSTWELDFSTPGADPSLRDQEQRFADAAELLYQHMLQIDFNGTTALDALGSAAVGDTDGDGRPEVVDAWGGPIYFQFQQPLVQRVDTTPPTSGVWAWNAAQTMTEVEVDRRFAANGSFDAATTDAAILESIKPVRVDQIRPFVSSTKLLEIDGIPQDFVLL